MFAGLLGTIVKSLSDSLLQALFGFVTQELDKRNLIAQGIAQQAAKETATSARTEAAVAAAQADAPQSKDAVLKALDGGNA